VKDVRKQIKEARLSDDEVKDVRKQIKEAKEVSTSESPLSDKELSRLCALILKNPCTLKEE